MRTFLNLLCVVTLAGCTAKDDLILGDPIREELSTPRSIAICYSWNRASLSEVRRRAQAHCQAQGLNARQTGISACRPSPYLAAIMELVSFDCVP